MQLYECVIMIMQNRNRAIMRKVNHAIMKIKAKRVKPEYESALNTKLGRGLIYNYPDLESGFHKYMLLGKLQCRQCLFNVKK